jgi:endonuclease YncB( thermonuclease family)
MITTGHTKYYEKYAPYKFGYFLRKNQARIDRVGLWRNEFNINNWR